MNQTRYTDAYELYPDTITAVTDSKLPAVIHRNGQVLFMNQPALEMFGMHSIADITGKNIDSLVDPSFLADVQAQRGLFKIGEPLVPMQGKLLRLDGTSFEAAITSFVINHAGEYASLTIIVDLGQEKQQDVEIEGLRDQLQKLTALMVGREVKMEELKGVIEKLKRKP